MQKQLGNGIPWLDRHGYNLNSLGREHMLVPTGRDQGLATLLARFGVCSLVLLVAPPFAQRHSFLRGADRADLRAFLMFSARVDVVSFSL